MDFDYILSVASQNQGVSNVQKRYSLQAGPSKKDPRSKGVNPAAVQALLKKQQNESKQKEIKKKKEKEELLAKRVELKSDRKARAMASRTKDNFRGYNGIPVVEGPKKRKSKLDLEEEKSMNPARVGFHVPDPEDDEDNYEYEQTDSETEQEPEPLRPDRSTSSKPSKKSTGPPKPPPTHLNFADLLKLAEKKQFEPVELKPKALKKEERLRTAEEIREWELERWAKRQDKDRDPKAERQRDSKSQSSTSSRKGTLEKEQKNSKLQKNVSEKSSMASDMGKRPNPSFKNDKGHSSSKPSVSDRERPKMSHGDRDRPKTSMSSSSSAINNKFSSKATSSQVSGKQMGPKPSSSHKSSTSSDLTMRKESSSLHGRPASTPTTRPPGTPGQKSQQSRPIQGALQKQGTTLGPQRSGKGELQRQSNSAVKPTGNSVMRPSLGGAGKPNQPQARPTGTFQAKPGGASQPRPGGSGLQGYPGGTGARPPGIGPGRPGTGGQAPGRLSGSVGSGPGRPKCTVVSETISSKNVGGPRPGVPPRPGMPQRPGMPPRPGMPQRPGMPPRPMNRPPGTMLPPITSAYKRKYEEEEEYDSEMDDFIDDGGDEQEEVSRHIKEIFGYDRNKYKEESDYALKFMESSWRDLQKEEARSLRLAVQEDLEEEKREEEELRQRNAKRKKRN